MFWSRLFRAKTKIENINKITVQSHSVALYDTEKKRLIGVFKSIELSAKYLFVNYRDKHSSRVSHALNKKNKIIEDTIFEFPVAVRMTNNAQSILLGNNACFINHDYPQRMNEKGQIK